MGWHVRHTASLATLAALVAAGLLLGTPHLHLPAPSDVGTVGEWARSWLHPQTQAPAVPALPAHVYNALFNVTNGANPHLRITLAFQTANGGWTVCQHAFIPRKGPAPTNGKSRPLVGHNTLCFVIPAGSKTWTYAYGSGPVGPPQP